MSIRTLNPNQIPKNATIGIFTPSEPLTEKRLNKLKDSLKILKKLGFNIKFAPNYNKSSFYMAGSIRDRIDDINFLLRDESVNMLMASWGGKSTSQLIKYLDYELISKSNKIITAFSDGTVLLNAINAKTGLITFCGPNVAGKLEESEWSELDFFQRASKGAQILSEKNISNVIYPGKVLGKLVGGNLSTFTLGLTGSSYLQDGDDIIFFFESGSASPQLLDQYLTLLDNSGFLQRIKAMVVGSLENCVDVKKDWGNRNPVNIIGEFVNKYRIPTIQTEAFGHGKRENPIFPIGAICELNTELLTLSITKNILK